MSTAAPKPHSSAIVEPDAGKSSPVTAMPARASEREERVERPRILLDAAVLAARAAGPG